MMLSFYLFSIGWQNTGVSASPVSSEGSLDILKTRTQSKLSFPNNHTQTSAKFKSSRFLGSLQTIIQAVLKSSFDITDAVFGSILRFYNLRLAQIMCIQGFQVFDSQVSHQFFQQPLQSMFDDLSYLTKGLFEMLSKSMILSSKSVAVPPAVFMFIKSVFNSFTAFSLAVFPYSEDLKLYLASYSSTLEFESSQIISTLSSLDSNYLVSLKFDHHNFVTPAKRSDMKMYLLSQIKAVGYNDDVSKNFFSAGYEEKLKLNLNQVGPEYKAFRMLKQLIFISNEDFVDTLSSMFQTLQNETENDSKILEIQSSKINSCINAKYNFLSSFSPRDLLNHITSRIISMLHNFKLDKQGKSPSLTNDSVGNSQTEPNINSIYTLNIDLTRKFIGGAPDSQSAFNLQTGEFSIQGGNEDKSSSTIMCILQGETGNKMLNINFQTVMLFINKIGTPSTKANETTEELLNTLESHLSPILNLQYKDGNVRIDGLLELHRKINKKCENLGGPNDKKNKIFYFDFGCLASILHSFF
ncbi:hypothetical protein BB560_004496 [Smittium megazygosporum]|uniref:Uncharacterized protein n=1 Tax=Smittium megazygosporum TaxID=133381 RepID=A0A2T9Z974_9FUNG|nr:hypothetical protein BB560_004496 [Smittium megazygosporum]